METQNLLEKEVGTLEKPKLLPKIVTIASVQIQTTTKDNKEMKTPLAFLECIHPDKKADELIKLSKVKYLDGDNVKTVSLWVQLDADGNIQKSSAIDVLLNFKVCKSLKELEGKKIETIEESKDSSYLCLKAY
jgi:hypothetical protein